MTVSPRTRPLLTVLGLTGLLLLTGCGESHPGGATATLPPLGAVPVVTDPQQITFPTDPYVLTVAQLRQLDRAQNAVTVRCMKGFGFTSKGVTAVGLDQEAAVRLSRNPVFGVFNPAQVAAKGYDYFVAIPPADPAGGPVPSAEEQTALNGTDATGRPVDSVNGMPLPPGGCAKKGRDAVGGKAPVIADSALPDGGPRTPPSDPRIADAYAKWAACMHGKGYTYPDPTAAVSDPRWKKDATGASPQQIATAGADVQCKIENNTVGVIVAVESAYGRLYIDSHGSALTAYRQRLDETLAKAAGLVAQG
ncbi:hypothetical protein [Kitasatospora azatica]|uniref:hypothetical protein n=1 Tax=Kitasatospora azatica TaxID=58347 RepID=UPI000564427D|nr:hypothetical protein [Kitasatospora azatica]